MPDWSNWTPNVNPSVSPLPNASLAAPQFGALPNYQPGSTPPGLTPLAAATGPVNSYGPLASPSSAPYYLSPNAPSPNSTIYSGSNNNGFPAGMNEFTNLPGVTDAISRQNLFQQNLWNGTINNGLQMAQYGANANSLAGQIGLANAQYGSDTGYLQGSNANQLAQLGLKGQGIGIQQAANTRQAGYLSDMYGVNRGAVDRRTGYLSNLHDIAGQLFGLQGKEAWQQADVSQRDLKSKAVAGGSFASTGYNTRIGDIANQLTDQGQQIDLNRQQETAQYGENQASNTDTGRKLDIQFHEDLASNTDAGRQLDLQAQGLGIDRNQLALDLQHGLEGLGLSNSVKVSDLLDKMQSNNIQEAMLAKQIYDAAFNGSDAMQTAPAQGG